MDEETIGRLRQEAEEEGDRAVIRACRRALEGDVKAIAVLEETLLTRQQRGFGEQTSKAARLSAGFPV